MKAKLKNLWLKAKTYIQLKFTDVLEAKNGWIKTGLALLALVVVGLLFVALVCAFVLFVVLVPGLVLGTILWFPWTYLELGATYFPTLDARWLNIQWFHFVVATAALAWLSKLFRSGKSTPAK